MVQSQRNRDTATLQDTGRRCYGRSCTLFSVFTHILPDDFRFYLNEFRRVLRPTARVYATVFLVDDEILTRQDPQSFLSFHHLFDDGCYLHDLAHPTQVVGYRFEALSRLVQQSGLELAIPPLRGHWSGLASFTLPPWAESSGSPGYNRYGFGGQDSIVLRPRAEPKELPTTFKS